MTSSSGRHHHHHHQVVGGGGGGHSSATNAMLLSVSFYVIFTTLPATLVYVLASAFPDGQILTELVPSASSAACVVRFAVDRARLRFEVFSLVRVLTNELCISHYACNFFMFFVTGREFRAAFRRTFCSASGSAAGWRSSMTATTSGGGGGASVNRKSSVCQCRQLSTTTTTTPVIAVGANTVDNQALVTCHHRHGLSPSHSSSLPVVAAVPTEADDIESSEKELLTAV